MIELPASQPHGDTSPLTKRTENMVQKQNFKLLLTKRMPLSSVTRISSKLAAMNRHTNLKFGRR